MCGIILLKGASASKRIKKSLELIKHRGPDDTKIWSHEDLHLGFQRLAITEQTSEGAQPIVYESLVGVINGEIYNHEELRKKHQLNNLNKCDTNVVLPLFSKSKKGLISELDGFYSGVIYDKETDKIFLIRDHIGKKPLFFGVSEGDFFITSELKAFDRISWFRLVPCGLSVVNIEQSKVELLEEHYTPKLSNNLYEVLEESVKKRIPSNEIKLGLFLSGGLDSSIITALVQKYRKDTIYFVLGDELSPDANMSTQVVNKFDLSNVCIVPLPQKKELDLLIREVVYFTESFNPSIVSNGLATYLLSKEAKKKGVKVVLSGEGADEFFGGYHYDLNANQWSKIHNNLVRDMPFTELRRLDLCSMAHSIEVRCPFLDHKVRSITEMTKIKDIFQPNINKVILRNTFAHILPNNVTLREKTSFDVGSGIRKMVVEYLTKNGRSEKDELYDIWREIFPNKNIHPYFHSYPVFDEVILKRGIVHR